MIRQHTGEEGAVGIRFSRMTLYQCLECLIPHVNREHVRLLIVQSHLGAHVDDIVTMDAEDGVTW